MVLLSLGMKLTLDTCFLADFLWIEVWTGDAAVQQRESVDVICGPVAHAREDMCFVYHQQSLQYPQPAISRMPM